MVVNVVCLAVGLGLVAVGIGIRAHNMSKQEKFNYMTWVILDTITTIFGAFSIVLIGLLGFLLVTSWLPF